MFPNEVCIGIGDYEKSFSLTANCSTAPSVEGFCVWCVRFNSLSPPCGAAGVLHEEREANGPQGDGSSSRGPLPHGGDAEQRGEGQGGFASSQWMSGLEL